MAFLALVWAVTIFVVVFMHKGARRIPIQYARLQRGRRVYGGQRHFLPLKVNMAGVMPIIFPRCSSSSRASCSSAGWSYGAQMFGDPTGFIYTTLYLLLIFSFCFFWNRLMFQPEDIANNLREHGSFIPGFARVRRSQVSVERSHPDHTGRRRVPRDRRRGSELHHRGHEPEMRYFLGTSVLIVVGVASNSSTSSRPA